MSKRNGKETETVGTQSEAVQGQSVEAPAPNMILRFSRNHPQNRSSYTIEGRPGLVGIQRDLVVGTTPFTSNTDLAGMPETITLGVELVQPKAGVSSTAKAEAAAAKAKEKADKAAAKVLAAQAKIEERAAKAKAALEAAQAKIAAAGAKVEEPAAV